MMDWNGSGNNHMDGAWGWFGGAMMVGLGLLALLAIVAVVVWLVRTTSAERLDRAPARSPRDVIDARFASGEIDEDQRQRMIDTLS